MKEEIIVVTMKGDVKYQIGRLNKEVSDVIKEIESCKSDFYPIIENCYLKKEEILSVEKHILQRKEKDSK